MSPSSFSSRQVLLVSKKRFNRPSSTGESSQKYHMKPKGKNHQELKIGSQEESRPLAFSALILPLLASTYFHPISCSLTTLHLLHRACNIHSQTGPSTPFIPCAQKLTSYLSPYAALEWPGPSCPH